MTQNQKGKLNPLITKFVNNLATLDAGERARLKRNAGNRLHESKRVMGLFYNKLLPYGTHERVDKWYFLVATLYPLQKEQSQIPPPSNFGASLRLIRTNDNGSGLDRRVERLLEADEQQIHFQLRQATHFLTSNRGRVDWVYLLRDLLQWSYPSRRVQRRWARAYFSKPTN